MTQNISGLGSSNMPAMVSGASMRMPPQQKMTSLYNKIDSAGTGSITQSQFNSAFQSMNPPTVFKNAGPTAIWQALDPTGSGTVSQQNFVDVMKNLMTQLRKSGETSGSQTAATAAKAMNNISV